MSARRCSPRHQLVEPEDGRAGIRVWRTIEWLPHIDRLMCKAPIADRHDREHEPLARIERYQHLVGRDRDCVAAVGPALDLDEMQMAGLWVAALDVVTDLGRRH